MPPPPSPQPSPLPPPFCLPCPESVISECKPEAPSVGVLRQHGSTQQRTGDCRARLMPECRTPGFLVISLPWLLPVLVILLFFCFPLLCSDFLPRSRSLPLSAAAALCQPLPDKCSQNESLISRPGVTEQVNSLGNKVGWLNTPRSRINQWLHSPPWAPAQVFAKFSERGHLFFFCFFDLLC